MSRITNKDLQQCCDVLKKRYGYDLNPHGTDAEGKYKPNPNVYHISSAYGGVALEQMMPEGSGVRRISCDGYGTKRQLYTFLRGMLSVAE